MKSVLIVEDDITILENLSEFLENEGYQPLKSKNGKLAIELLHHTEQMPFAILLDLSMPVMDGMQFRVEQENNPRFANIPIILMSADPQIDIARFKLGAVSYIKKPIDIEVLSEKLKAIKS